MAAEMDLSFITGVYNQVVTISAGLAPKLLTHGKRLTGALALILVSWEFIKLFLAEAAPGEVVGRLVEVLILICMVVWMLTSYQPIFLEGLLGSLDRIGQELSGVDPTRGITAAFASMLKAGEQLMEAQPWPQISGPIDFLQKAGPMFVAMLFYDGMFVAMLAIAVVFAGCLVISQCLAGIALALGPVFIPWLLLSATDFVFNGWLRFLIVAGLYKVVGLVILAITQGMAGYLEQAAAAIAATAPGTVNIVPVAAMIFVAGTMLMLMFQVPSIANGLMSGSAMVSLPKFRVPKPGN